MIPYTQIFAGLFTLFILLREIKNVTNFDNRHSYEIGYGPWIYGFFVYLWCLVIIGLDLWWVSFIIGTLVALGLEYKKKKNNTLYIAYDPMEAFVGRHGLIFDTDKTKEMMEIADKYAKPQIPKTIALFQLAPGVSPESIEAGTTMTIVKKEDINVADVLPQGNAMNQLPIKKKEEDLQAITE